MLRLKYISLVVYVVFVLVPAALWMVQSVSSVVHA